MSESKKKQREPDPLFDSALSSSDREMGSVDVEDIEDLTGGHLDRYTTQASLAQRAKSLDKYGGVPPMGGNRAWPPRISNEDDYKVEFDGPDDPLCPLNWRTRDKFINGLIMTYPSLALVWGSAVYGSAMVFVEEEFHIGRAVSALGVSLYILGFACGPVFWGPLSEVYGRRLPMVVSLIGLTCFSWWAATASKLHEFMIYRFCCGSIGGASMSIIPAALGDILPVKTRGVGISMYSLCVVAGPAISPMVGGFLANSSLGWRSTLYSSAIMSSVAMVLVVFFLKETYHPVILKQKARRIRAATGNHFVYAAHERVELDTKVILEKVITVPFRMLLTEPILMLTATYQGFLYGVLYLCLDAVPIIFSDYGWKGGVVTLPYISLFLGAVVANLSNLFIFDPKFKRDLAKSGKQVYPEARLPMMMVGACVFPSSIFLLCWSGAYQVFWFVPVLGLFFLGYGIITLFQPVINYTIDTFRVRAASAMAANTFLRCGMGAAFPIFGTAMFHNLGTQWAGTLLGCLALLLSPVPFVFFFWGPKLRAMSKNTTA